MSAEYWVWLQQVLGYGNEAVARVISNYGTAKDFYQAPDSEKIAKCRLSKQQADRLHTIPRKVIYKIMDDAAKSGINIITPEDSLYPERLRNIPDPPAVLYVKGSRFDFNGLPAIAIVGPRKISHYGEKCAYTIANTLAACGFCVVSGGALGGDSSAHRGAIATGGYTIGVLGSGIESDYLKVNAELRENIAKYGCLISEYPPFVGVTRGSFPKRNRIMSGLSNGVVIVEGAKDSGTMITARHAEEQGKDVFVIPGSPSLKQYEGSNQLIADGARPLLHINDIITEYAFLYPDKIHEPQFMAVAEDSVDENNIDEAANDTERSDVGILSETAVRVLEAFEKCNETFVPDDAVDITGFDAGSVLGAVTELEICGFIEAVPGGRYRLTYNVN